MSSLRLALKQSLAESAQAQIQSEREEDRRRRSEEERERERERRRLRDARRKQEGEEAIRRRRKLAREMAAVARQSQQANLVSRASKMGDEHHEKRKMVANVGKSESTSTTDEQNSLTSDSDVGTGSSSARSKLPQGKDESENINGLDAEHDPSSSENEMNFDETDADETDEENVLPSKKRKRKRKRKRKNSKSSTATTATGVSMPVDPTEAKYHSSEPIADSACPSDGKRRRKKKRKAERMGHPSGSKSAHDRELSDKALILQRQDHPSLNKDLTDEVKLLEAKPSQNEVCEDHFRQGCHKQSTVTVAAVSSVGSVETPLKKKKKKKKKSSKPLTVPQPIPRVLTWVRSMSEGRQRRNIREGHRVKVQFNIGCSSEGNPTKKRKRLRWYGGLITDVLSHGRRIRILYDDGTSEITNFPDKDIIVDADDNGKHAKSVGGNRWEINPFIPPPPKDVAPSSDGGSKSASVAKRERDLVHEKADHSDSCGESKTSKRDGSEHDSKIPSLCKKVPLEMRLDFASQSMQDDETGGKPMEEVRTSAQVKRRNSSSSGTSSLSRINSCFSSDDAELRNGTSSRDGAASPAFEQIPYENNSQNAVFHQRSARTADMDARTVDRSSASQQPGLAGSSSHDSSSAYLCEQSSMTTKESDSIFSKHKEQSKLYVNSENAGSNMKGHCSTVRKEEEKNGDTRNVDVQLDLKRSNDSSKLNHSGAFVGETSMQPEYSGGLRKRSVSNETPHSFSSAPSSSTPRDLGGPKRMDSSKKSTRRRIIEDEEEGHHSRDFSVRRRTGLQAGIPADIDIKPDLGERDAHVDTSSARPVHTMSHGSPPFTVNIFEDHFATCLTGAEPENSSKWNDRNNLGHGYSRRPSPTPDNPKSEIRGSSIADVQERHIKEESIPASSPELVSGASDTQHHASLVSTTTNKKKKKKGKISKPVATSQRQLVDSVEVQTDMPVWNVPDKKPISCVEVTDASSAIQTSPMYKDDDTTLGASTPVSALLSGNGRPVSPKSLPFPPIRDEGYSVSSNNSGRRNTLAEFVRITTSQRNSRSISPAPSPDDRNCFDMEGELSDSRGTQKSKGKIISKCEKTINAQNSAADSNTEQHSKQKSRQEHGSKKSRSSLQGHGQNNEDGTREKSDDAADDDDEHDEEDDGGSDKGGAGVAVEPQEEKWVQCDRCMKWRLLPQSLSMDELPDRWYCELNVYDPKRRSCDAPEQSAEDVLRERELQRKRKKKKKKAKSGDMSKHRISKSGRKKKVVEGDTSSSEENNPLADVRSRDASCNTPGMEDCDQTSSRVGDACFSKTSSVEIPRKVCRRSSTKEINYPAPGEKGRATCGVSTSKVGKQRGSPTRKAGDMDRESGSDRKKEQTCVSSSKNDDGIMSDSCSAGDHCTSSMSDRSASVGNGHEDLSLHAKDRVTSVLESIAPKKCFSVSSLSGKDKKNARPGVSPELARTSSEVFPVEKMVVNDDHGYVSKKSSKSSSRNRHGRKKEREISTSSTDTTNKNPSRCSSGNKIPSSSKDDTKDDKNKELADNQQEWVQCEKCEKWRRLPPRIRAADLPDVWYCSMNTWDIRSATCAAAEDIPDASAREYTILGGEGATSAVGSSRVGGGGSNSSGKLSYRNLIFGNGRKQSRPASERARAVESLFVDPESLHGDSDGDGERCVPTVLYATSSAFVPRGGTKQAENESTKTSQHVSFLELMSKSKMWKDLRGGCANIDTGHQVLESYNTVWRKVPKGSPSGSVDHDVMRPRVHSSLDCMKGMKGLVYHVLGFKTAPFAVHEVLLEAQCRKWNAETKAEEDWAELRATCTLENITHSLNDLVSDGLVEVIHGNMPGEPVAGMNALIRYRRLDHNEVSPSTSTVVSNPNTRCIKLVKPWKSAVSLGKRCRWSDADECEELLQHARRRFRYLSQTMGPDPLHIS